MDGFLRLLFWGESCRLFFMVSAESAGSYSWDRVFLLGTFPTESEFLSLHLLSPGVIESPGQFKGKQ